MIQETEEYFGVVCDFCGEHLRDDSLGGELVTETVDEAHLLADHYEWFAEEERHYCTKCVPSVQELKEPWLNKWAKVAFPTCSKELAFLTALFGSIILVSVYFGGFIVSLVGIIGYGLLIRHHYVLHQRNEAIYVLLQVLRESEESED